MKRLKLSPIRLMLACVVGVFSLAALAILPSLTSANSVSPSSLVNVTSPVTPDDLTPVECNGISVSQVVNATGTFTGPAGGALILGTSGDDDITGGSGDDCILGGDGADELAGGPGNDVCVGSGAATIDAVSCEVHFP